MQITYKINVSYFNIHETLITFNYVILIRKLLEKNIIIYIQILISIIYKILFYLINYIVERSNDTDEFVRFKSFMLFISKRDTKIEHT